jgi:hypothetical protein
MFEIQVTDGSRESFNARPLNRQRGEIVHGGCDDNDDGDVNHDNADHGEDDGGGGSGGTEGGGVDMSLAIAPRQSTKA